MKHESERNIRLNYKARPGSGQNIAKVNSIQDTTNTLKSSLIENLVSNTKVQNRNDTLFEYASLFRMERMISLD